MRTSTSMSENRKNIMRGATLKNGRLYGIRLVRTDLLEASFSVLGFTVIKVRGEEVGLVQRQAC